MMNFEKYRKFDVIKLHANLADIYKRNEKGELIDPIGCKDYSWLTPKSVFAKAEEFNFEDFILNEINRNFLTDVEPKDMQICGSELHFWKQENVTGMEDAAGEYFVDYAVAITINGKCLDEGDLSKIFPDFEY